MPRQARRGKVPAAEALETRTLLSAAPVVSTAAATSISATEATLNGSVNPEGSTATVRFQYSSDPTFAPTVETVVGSGFVSPTGVAVDAAGDVFVADESNNTVKEVLTDGTIKNIGSGFIGPADVAVDAAGDVFVADSTGVKEVLPNGTINTIGSGFLSAIGVAVDAAGDVFVADAGNHAVKEVLPNGTIKTILAPTNAFGVAVDVAGNVFVGDNNTVKEVLPDGTVKTIGSGFNGAVGVAVDAAGNVFVADENNNAVKEILPDGTINTISTAFKQPIGVTVDATGDVFVADTGNSRVIELSPPTVAAEPSPLTGLTAQAVSATATGLTPGTTYYFRAVAASAGGTVAGSTVDFTTPPAIALLAGQPGDGTPQTFVQNLYRELLGREPDAPGDSFWVNYLKQHNNSAGQAQVVQAFLNSHEYAVHYIATLYHVILGRAPDAPSLQYWTSKMGSPGTPGGAAGSADEKAIVAAFFGSDEFYIKAGNTPQSWINAVYQDVFGRTADGQGLGFWTNELTVRGAGGRDGIIRELLSSPEAAHLVLDSFYPAAGGTNSHPLPVPGAPAGAGSTELATIAGDGWENLYLQGPYNSQPQGNDGFFDLLAGGVGWDDVQLLLLKTSQYDTNPNRPVTS
ncbi:MAG TPA: DUF4214 domain-containing protein [Pirellulales bacterium]|nr:DUF4214 domain-containing protein [Pirellulales bacterium]